MSPAVAPPAPVSTPRSAAPPGSGPPEAQAETGQPFGTILNSARTAVAEGQRETGTKSGIQQSNSSAGQSTGADSESAATTTKSSNSDDATTDAAELAAAVALLTGQSPAQSPQPGSGGTTSSAASGTAASAGSSTSGATAAAGGEAAGTDAAGPDGSAGQAAAGSAAALTAIATQALGAQPKTAGTTAAVSADDQSAASGATTPPSAQASSGDSSQQAAPASASTAAELQAAIHPELTAKPAPATVATNAESTPTTTDTAATTEPATAKGSGGQSDAHGQGHAGFSSADTNGQTAGGSAAGAATGTQSAFSIPGAAQATPVAQTVRAPAPASTFIRQPVGLDDAVDTVRATFVAANQAGISSARITLAPASLGGITISLQQTPDGLVARVAAEHPEALHTLQQNVNELRQSLQQSGVTLLHLDIGHTGEQALGGARDQGQHSKSGSGSATTAGESPDEDTPESTEATLQLGDGALVDVLA